MEVGNKDRKKYKKKIKEEKIKEERKGSEGRSVMGLITMS